MNKEALIAGWEAHLRSELIDKNVDATMKTMTSDPYVNHVPTMTGGVGAAQVRRFYKHHFISRQPQDFEVVPVSRTIGEDTIVDEMVARFTHSCRMDYLLPGVAPTHRRVQIPIVVVAHFDGDKLAHEHYLLGPGIGFGSGWSAKPGKPSDRRRRDCEQSSRSSLAQQRADAC